MTAVNEYARRMQYLRNGYNENVKLAVRRNATADKFTAGEMRDRQRRVVRERLVIAATLAVAMGEYDTVPHALESIAKEHGVCLIAN